jgi:metal-sulfur cluster biosynthetic enzyme
MSNPTLKITLDLCLFLFRPSIMNLNPSVRGIQEKRIQITFVGSKLAKISVDTIYELIRDIKDPEHPQTLEQLGVVSKEYIDIGKIRMENRLGFVNIGLPLKYIEVRFFPTIPHCSMAGIIGICLKTQLLKYISEDYWIKVLVIDGAHVDYEGLNKQLSDKDRVSAALENRDLADIVDECIPPIL